MRQPLKILIHDTGKVVGGIERCISTLCRHLDRDRFHVTLLHEESQRLQPWLDEIDSLGIARKSCPLSRMSDLKNLPAVVSWIRSEGFDIVHSHLDQRYISLASWFAGVSGLLWTYHVRIPSLKKYQHVMNQAALLLGQGQIVTVSEAILKHLQLWGYPSERMQVVYNGLDPVGPPPEDFNPAGYKDSLGLPPDALTVLVPARISDQKGHRYLLESIWKLKSNPSTQRVHYILAGDGPLMEEMMQLAEKAEIDGQVHFLGFRNDMDQLLRCCDFVVLPSLWEGLPLVLIEALSAGKPSVATDVDGSAEVIEHGRTGLLVPPADPEALSTAIAEMASDEGMRERFGANGVKVFNEKFDVKIHIEKIQRVYESIPARTRRWK